jgi:hypothetical protein
MMSKRRYQIAFVTAGVVFLVVVTALALTIKTQQWGVAVMFVVPFIVYWLMKLARALENWARADEEEPDVD